jgi:hypothetical protein
MNDRIKVVHYIVSALSDKYKVIDNTGADKKIISGQFPDILVYKKDSVADKDLLFVMKVENGGELIDSLPQWKELANAPSVFYIVARKTKLDDAKKLAAATGIRARFAWYEIKDEKVAQLMYE